MLNSKLVAPRVPLIDQRTGNISREWYLFLLSVKDINDATLNDIDVLQTDVVVLQTDMANVEDDAVIYPLLLMGA